MTGRSGKSRHPGASAPPASAAKPEPVDPGLPAPITDRLFRGIAGAAPTIIWMDDADGRCVFVNKTWCEFTGRPEADGLGDGWANNVHPDDRSGFRRAFLVAVARRQPFELEYRMRRHDGAWRWVIDTARPLFDDDGSYLGHVGSVADITERKQAEEELQRRATALQRLNTELENSNRGLDAFAYIAAHDLKEPLRGMHHFSQFLLEDHADRLTEDGVEKLRTLMRLTQRMESLLESLLHYSYLGRAELALERVDIHRVVEETVELLAARLHESQVDVRVAARLPSVQADRVHVGEIFNNLIANAIKYNNKAEKWVEIGCEPSSEGGAQQPVFYVRDNGIGIAPQHHEAIFRIFRRLHGREEYGGGTGAGLTIVRKIVERHGGKIWLVSQPGAGSTFYFTLGTCGDRTHTTYVFDSAG